MNELHESDRRIIERIRGLLVAGATVQLEIDVRAGRISDYIEHRTIKPVELPATGSRASSTL